MEFKGLNKTLTSGSKFAFELGRSENEGTNMKLEEIESALHAIGCELRKDGEESSFDFHGGRVMVEDRNGEVILSSMIGHLSEIQESGLPNVVISFLDANLHLQPASVGILVEEHDVAIKATVLVDNKASLKKSLAALDMAIRTGVSIMAHASEVAMA